MEAVQATEVFLMTKRNNATVQGATILYMHLDMVGNDWGELGIATTSITGCCKRAVTHSVCGVYLSQPQYKTSWPLDLATSRENELDERT
jgi:hypothetical protein